MRIKILSLACFLAFRSNAAVEVGAASDRLIADYHLVPAPATAGLLLQKGDRLAICGDSITEQKMYSRIVDDYLTACTPELKISVRQFGWGGERADGFLRRMTNDCLRFHPTIATTSYGMNDHGYQPYQESIGDAYRSNMQAVVKAFEAHGVRVVVGSPGTITKVPWWEAGKYQIGDLNHSLGQLRNIDLEIAGQEKVGFADVFAPMLRSGAAGKEKYGEKYELNGDDGIHPNWAGHTVMAYAFLKALGLSGDIATFTADLSGNRMTVSDGHKLLSAKNGEYVIRSTRYPFCSGGPLGLAANWYPTAGHDNVTNNDNLRSGMTLVPFNQDLNRFVLTARNATAGEYRVTWGDESKVFSREQLTNGINLAAEFTLNPFSRRFALIDAAVSAKQDFETRQIKVLFRPANDKATVDQIAKQTEEVVADTERQHAALENVIRTAYAPVTYTLRISPE
jgi:lysophospholipase L1-like esterase